MSTTVTEVTDVKVDRFGNPVAEGLPYARGDLIRDTPDDLNKVKRAEMLARKRLEMVSAQSLVEHGLTNNSRVFPCITSPVWKEI